MPWPSVQNHHPFLWSKCYQVAMTLLLFQYWKILTRMCVIGLPIVQVIFNNYIIMFVNLLLSLCLLNVIMGCDSRQWVFLCEKCHFEWSISNWELYYLMRCFLWKVCFWEESACMAFEKYRLYGVDSSYRNYQGVSFCMVSLHACVMWTGNTICPTTTHYLGKS